LLAVAVAERIAMSPAPPIGSEMISSWMSATSLAATWLMKMSR
jgi:hypothetical protein